MKMHMINHLMRNAPIILQNIVVGRARRLDNLFGYTHYFEEIIVGDVKKFGAVVFRDYEL